jgi:hypothetical protein
MGAFVAARHPAEKSVTISREERALRRAIELGMNSFWAVSLQARTTEMRS